MRSSTLAGKVSTPLRLAFVMPVSSRGARMARLGCIELTLGLALTACLRRGSPQPVSSTDSVPSGGREAVTLSAASPRHDAAAVARETADASQGFVPGSHVPATGAVLAALRTHAHELIWMLSPPRALGDGRFFAVTLHGLSTTGSSAVVVSLSSDDPAGHVHVDGRQQVVTDQLAFPVVGGPDDPNDPYANSTDYNYELPAVDGVQLADFDRDHHAEAAIQLRYSSEHGLCETGFDVKSQFVVVRFDPAVVIAASIVTTVQPQVEFSPHRQSRAAWSDVNHDGHPDLVVTGESCTGQHAPPDGGPDGELVDTCSPIHDQYLWQVDTGTWLASQPMPGGRRRVRPPCR